MADYDLSGKTALITGASKGIGAATAFFLADKGAKVVLVARSAAAIESLAAEIDGKPIACDVADASAMKTAFDAALDWTGRVDILVNNAGIIDPIARLADADPSDWQRVVDVNLMGVFHGMNLAIPIMEKQGAGTIINISSGAATGALEGWSHYCATKAAVLSLTKCGHKEVGDRGVTVVGFSPGTVATDMQVAIKDSGVNPVSQLDWSDHITPEEAAQAIAYLCTEAGAEYAGGDFSIKTPEGRAAAGLEPR